ncbi:MFS transporter [Sciscionella sediminilitoris]|uniref:MFS transporter n=1 Tax=Sciscionella sediminilitoris TaxID=1445613 RepID=UPI0004DFBDE6|nr:MFS transporter [Sciscionella sp. SE31]
MTVTSEPRIGTRRAPATPGTLPLLGLLTVLGGQFLAIVDVFIVNVALPSMGAELHMSRSSEELIVAGYGLSYALFLVLGGRLGDNIGRKRLFLIGMAAFTLTSLACGLAPTPAVLVAARVAQGASAAMMVPQVLGTITAATTGAARAKAIGAFGATGGIASVVGQLAGGVLVAADIAGSGWRPIFLVNVPIGILALIGAARWMPGTRSEIRSRLDLRGTMLLGLTVLLLMVPLLEGQSLGWPLWIFAPLLAVPFAALAFFRTQQRIEHSGGAPLLAPSLLRMPSLRRGLLVSVPFFLGWGGFTFGYVFALQQGLGFSALECGLALVPLGLAFLTASLSAPRLVNRFGGRVMRIGILVQLAGLIGIGITVFLAWPDVGIAAVAPWIAAIGGGNGLVMGPLFRVVLADVPTERAGTGGGTMTTVQQISLAIGVAGLGTVLNAFGTSGMHAGFSTLVVVVAVLSLIFAIGSRVLPEPR